MGALILALSLLPSFVSAKGFVRQNDFMNKSGSERTHSLKKWQARMNLPVTGGLMLRQSRLFIQKITKFMTW